MFEHSKCLHCFHEDGHSIIAMAVHGKTGWYEIAKVYGGNGPHKENSILFAAAPDLLAACERTLEALNKSIRDEKTDGDYWWDCMDVLEAAIAKAKGGTQ